MFFALLLARNNNELATLRTFAEKCSIDKDDKDLKNIVFIVFDEVMTDIKYEQFIEFQANYACASSHGFLDQQKVHKDHAMAMVKEWMESVQRNNAIVYINGEDKQPISVKHLSYAINSSIAPIIFPYGPDAHEILRQKAPSTFWKQQNSKEMVRTFLFATTKSEFFSINQQMRPIQYLIQDCLDENLNWVSGISDEHPFKAACDKVNKIIKHSDKSLPFNLDDKFSILTQPPYGFYSSFAAMGIMAFALRPWVNKIFDPQGKPRDANALIDDIVLLFKVWDDNKSNSKLNFKFQTPEEGKLCKELISLFNLNGKGNTYSDVTSLKDARFAITGDFLAKKNNPLWTLKYASPSAFASLPIIVSISDNIKILIDDILQICMERDLRNPALVNQTLSLIEEQPDIQLQIQKAYGFNPDFENAKRYLEENDGAGNTFKATSKPVLIGTAVVGATTMIFSLILVIKNVLNINPESILSLLNPYTLLGFISGGAVIYWFSGASMQAVTTGAYSAVEYIKKHIKLGEADDKKANLENSKEVVKICTQYAQKGMFNIFVALFSFALAFAFLSAPISTKSAVSFFISYLIAIAVFGLFQAVFMANAGGCWDNAKKIVEVDLDEKGTPLHDATVVGDTVGDPFKDTSSVAMNPIIKFTTLFGLLAMEIALSAQFASYARIAGVVFLIVALVFVIRSFYYMRIPKRG